MTLRILIAEDYKDLADSYKMALEGRGHEVTITGNGIECQRAYKQYTKQLDGQIKQYFDVVILDQNMPGMDGIDVAKEIQKINHKQRIIFITGYGIEVIQKLKQLTSNAAVMNKPFTVEALLAEVEGWPVSKLREMLKKGLKEWDGHTGTSVPVGPSRVG
ncbi:MAG TPA: response regulator [Candidatus Nitrosotalea sp.]|nr:response regulator [Candidatus Nitrosotalea sp.]